MSTVRHVIANKYLATAHGIVALTEFFDRGPKLAGSKPRSSLMVTWTPQGSAEEMGVTRRRPPVEMERLREGRGASRLAPDEEQRVRRALEAYARRRQAVPPPQGEEAQDQRDQEAQTGPHRRGSEWGKPAADPEVRAAYHDLQTALSHPQLRPAVLLALQDFAQAALAGTPPAPAAEALAFPFVELGPNRGARPDVETPSPVHDFHALLHQTIRRVATQLKVEGVSMMLLDDARQDQAT